MTSGAKSLVQNSQWLRELLDNQERREALLDLLPQGPDSGLNADMVDGLHAVDLIAQCIEEIKKIDLLLRTSAGTATSSSSDAVSIKGKTIDDSGIGDGKVLAYDAAAGAIVYLTVAQIAKGSATVTATNTFVDVPHGLTVIPSLNDINVTPQTNLDGRDFWTSDPGPVTFRINISSADFATDFVFSWSIIY